MLIDFVSRFGECKGSDTQILSDDQWSWFESELDKESEIKIIGSGVQVLPPTDQITKFPEQFCAHDSHNGDSESNNNTFMEAIDRVGESKVCEFFTDKIKDLFVDNILINVKNSGLVWCPI